MSILIFAKPGKLLLINYIGITSNNQQVSDNYFQVKQDIQNLIEQEVYKLKMQKENAEESLQKDNM